MRIHIYIRDKKIQSIGLGITEASKRVSLTQPAISGPLERGEHITKTPVKRDIVKIRLIADCCG